MIAGVTRITNCRGLSLAVTFLAFAAILACGGGGEKTALEIAFISLEDDNPEIYSIEASGETNSQRLTSTRDASERQPVYSPDRLSIAFLSDRNGVDDLFVMDADGNGEQRAVETDGKRTSFAWGPNSARIAYVSESEGFTEVFVVDIEEKRELRLTKNDFAEQLGGWSPDGVWIVYAVTTEGPNQGIYKKNPDGVDEIQLTEDTDFLPRFSPDGKKIAFESTQDGDREIYVLDDDGENEAAENVSKKSGDDYDFDWSPDSKRLIFVSERDENPEIYVVDANGKNPKRLTNNRAIDANPRWSPDGKQIIFASDADGDMDLFMMDADGDNQRRLTTTDFAATQPDW